MKTKKVALIAMLAISQPQFASEDNLTTELEEVVVMESTLKEDEPLWKRASMLELLSKDSPEKKLILNMKDLSMRVPNMMNPDYGSKTTSTMYIRGIGSRMDQPAVGLYVDGIPYMNKSSFDFGYNDIEKILVTLGPQGTLYGRNTMAGIIDMTTKQPDTSTVQTDVNATYGLHNWQNLSVAHMNHIGKVGIGATAFYNHHDGLFINKYSNSHIDDETSAGARINLTYNKNIFSLQFTSSYEYSQQKGYPYAQLDSLGNNNGIDYNIPSTYYRQLFTNGLRLSFELPRVIITSATSYQYLDDNMTVDNDFTAKDYFSLQQKQREHDITEEVVIKKNYKNQRSYKYDHISGVSAFRRNLDIKVPTILKEEALNDYIEGTVNNVAMLQRMSMALDITDDELPIVSMFEYPSYGSALFHQSTIRLNKRLSLKIGARVDYEKVELKYDDDIYAHYIFTPTIKEVQTIYTYLHGKESQDFVELLPKLTLSYNIEKGLLYASVAKGFKSGGYNTQMFADILQYKLKTEMQEDLYYKIMEAMPVLPDVAKQGMESILLGAKEIDVKKTIEYKPEYSWNYEIGAHLRPNNYFRLDVDLFYIDCRDQQITVFSDLGGMGRMTQNAGRTRSFGGELRANYTICPKLSVEANYGYTNATFRQYRVNDSTSYRGNKVPYAPEQTLMLGATFAQPINKKWADMLLVTANYRSAANIYWNEENTCKQDYYGTLDADITLTRNNLNFSVWGKNLTDNEYDTFYFESMGNKFVQKGKPVQIGATLRLKL